MHISHNCCAFTWIMPASGVGISVTPSPCGTSLQEEGWCPAVQTPHCPCGNSPSRGWGAGAAAPTPRTHLFIQQAPSPCPHQSLSPTGRVWVFLQLRAKKHNRGHTKLTPSPCLAEFRALLGAKSHIFTTKEKPKVHTCCINIYICAYIHTYTHVMLHPTPSAWGGPCSVSSPSPAPGSPMWRKLGKKPKSTCSITASVMSTLTTSKHPTWQLHKFHSLQSCPSARSPFSPPKESWSRQSPVSAKGAGTRDSTWNSSRLLNFWKGLTSNRSQTAREHPQGWEREQRRQRHSGMNSQFI